MFEFVVVGGTFDRLHKGHKRFLDTAFSLGKNVDIGLTSDEFTKKKPLYKLVQTYEERLAELIAFLKKNDHLGRAVVFKINDPHADTTSTNKYDAIVVTDDTKSAAEAINRVRAEKKLKPLVIIQVPLVLADDGLPIASSRIRAGAIDRDGRVLCSVVTRSVIRRNIAKLLAGKSAYGYELHKAYKKTFGEISLRLLYYHLAKGCEEGTFQIKELKKERGGYSWGESVNRIYYELGPKKAFLKQDAPQ